MQVAVVVTVGGVCLVEGKEVECRRFVPSVWGETLYTCLDFHDMYLHS